MAVARLDLDQLNKAKSKLRLSPQSQIPVVIAYAPATLTFHYVAQETWVIIQQDNFESIQVGSLLDILLTYPHPKETSSTWTSPKNLLFLQGFIVFEVTTNSTFTRQNIQLALP
ncbi:hypothetical protein B0H34DRAFT_675102 [Crassisporium funariophilum]|nr:hypothetical protein B0H34DRAFT_675102 [Crassisporium funariophilum]